MQALAANEKVSRFGIRELERILDEMLANQMLQAKDAGGLARLSWKQTRMARLWLSPPLRLEEPTNSPQRHKDH